MDKTIINYFHHIHHKNGKHEVHHCGGKHCKIDHELDYEIKHCKCGKHQIDKEVALGHDFGNSKVKIKFTEKCPNGGWHIESGIIINK